MEIKFDTQDFDVFKRQWERATAGGVNRWSIPTRRTLAYRITGAISRWIRRLAFA